MRADQDFDPWWRLIEKVKRLNGGLPTIKVGATPFAWASYSLRMLTHAQSRLVCNKSTTPDIVVRIGCYVIVLLQQLVRPHETPSPTPSA